MSIAFAFLREKLSFIFNIKLTIIMKFGIIYIPLNSIKH